MQQSLNIYKLGWDIEIMVYIMKHLHNQIRTIFVDPTTSEAELNAIRSHLQSRQ